jgi:1-acyl-sn-glycerol-3-phosphate acyltransferase
MHDITAIRPARSPRRLMQKLGRALLPLIGWRATGDLPDAPKFVLVVYPHTSNWDLPIGLIAAYALGLLEGWPYGFLVKDTAMKWPVIGPVIRKFGGVAIDRRARFNAVEQMAAVFQQRERLFVAITPEGTRRRQPYIKSGFYHLACLARVPIVPAYLDYRKREAHLGPLMWPSGDSDVDLQTLRAFFAGVTPLYPQHAGEFRFKPTDEPAGEAQRQPAGVR